MSTHTEGKSCSISVRVLVLNDPPARAFEMGVVSIDDEAVQVRGLHSSTFQLNLSRF